MKRNRRIISRLQPANARAKHNACTFLRLLAFLNRIPAGIFQGFVRGSNGIENKIIDAFGVARTHHIVGIENPFLIGASPGPAIGAGNDGSDFASNIADVEMFYFGSTGLTVQYGFPCSFNTASDGRN